MTTVHYSKPTDNNTFITALNYNDKVDNPMFPGTKMIVKKRFYVELEDSIEEGTELPDFNPNAFHIRTSEYTTTDEETGEEVTRTANWLDGMKA